MFVFDSNKDNTSVDGHCKTLHDDFCNQIFNSDYKTNCIYHNKFLDINEYLFGHVYCNYTFKHFMIQRINIMVTNACHVSTNNLIYEKLGVELEWNT